MCESDLDMSRHHCPADSHERLAVLAHEVGLLHVLDKVGPESCIVIAFVALVGLDVPMDCVHMVPQLCVVGVSIEIRVLLAISL